jgi:CRP-like cAMP-binding protein
VHDLCKQLSLHRAEDGDVICRQGDPADNAYIVLAGEVAVHVDNKRRDCALLGHSYGKKVNILEAGSCFGELGASTIDSARTASVIASSSEVTLAMVSNASIRSGGGSFEDEIHSRVKTLRELPEFSRFGTEELIGIAYRMISQRIDKGRDVFTTEQNMAGVFILESGEVQLAVPVGTTGRTSKFKIIAPGFVGLEDMQSVATGAIKTYSYTATSTEASKLLFIDKKSIDNLCLLNSSPMKTAGSKRALVKRLSKTVGPLDTPSGTKRALMKRISRTLMADTYTDETMSSTMASSSCDADLDQPENPTALQSDTSSIEQPNNANAPTASQLDTSIEQLCILATMFPVSAVVDLAGATITLVKNPQMIIAKQNQKPASHYSHSLERDVIFNEEALCLHARLNTLSFSPPAFYSNLAARKISNTAYRNSSMHPSGGSPSMGSPRHNLRVSEYMS